ncbi:hypothetical protein [Lactiplantibacillus xiangfangensis]|uniref:hypothetical protein n=1 Tax=Lactiplantibacillus xiangfangensis TaxID=942150 RepID=UPI00070E10F4|nr:hypothetical protein [Lactiplantibacillus xiangfangensis]
MKTIKLGLAGALMLVIVWLMPVAAFAQSETQTGVSFTPSTSTVVDPATIQANHHIPTGQTIRQTDTGKASNAGAMAGTLQKTLQSGRLPQTAEAYAWYVRILGGLLLLSAVLGYLVWRDVQLTERGTTR